MRERTTGGDGADRGHSPASGQEQVRARFFGDMSWDSFRAEILARHHCVFRHGDPERFSGLFVLADLERYLFAVAPALVDELLQVVRSVDPAAALPDADPQSLSERPDPPPSNDDDVLRAYARGFSVILNAVDEHWMPVARLADGLTQLFGMRANANVYLTPPGSRAFPPHFDAMHVVVAQTEGVKHWRLYTTPPPDITPRMERVSAARLGAPLNVRMEPGDVLYIPPGLRHEAYTTDRHSVHITFGVTPLRLGDLLSRLASRSRLVEPVDGRWLDCASEWPRAGDLSATVARALDDPGSELVEREIASLMQEIVARARPLPSRYLASLLSLEALSPDTVLCRRLGWHGVLRGGATRCTLVLPEGVLELPKRLEAAAAFVLRDGRFRVGDIPGLTPEAQVRFARDIILRGAVELADAPGDSDGGL